MTYLEDVIDVVDVRVVSRYVVEMLFANGESRVIDLEAFLTGPIFEPLRVDYRRSSRSVSTPSSGRSCGRTAPTSHPGRCTDAAIPSPLSRRADHGEHRRHQPRSAALDGRVSAEGTGESRFGLRSRRPLITSAETRLGG